ncbi:neural cell adhesion molecule 1-like [Cyprinus carpio]|uniref:Neural cell adhesion molecule 1-like n=1 Tax=Cyprinus carpio TaxID=7962 RepID=A0A9Q9YCY3_CYPCA|nr:neural cell adhesion molecule 1-like [Cyprinus carpio]
MCRCVDYCGLFRCFTITSVLIEAPKPRLTVQTETSQIFRGKTVTLTCDIQGEGWRYTWQCGDEQHNSDEEEFKITVQFKQSCKCKGCRESFCSEWSDAETLNVSVIDDDSGLYHEIFTDKPSVTVKPQSSVFTGDTVTLICDVRRSTERTIYWYKNFKRIKAGSETETLRKVRVSDGGRYACSVERETTQSQGVMLTVEERPKPVVRVQPDGRVFRGQTVTLTCDIQDTDVTNWSYSWNKDDSEIHVSQSQEYRISSVSESHTGNYSCTGRETGGSRYSHTSEKVTLTVSEAPKPRLTVQTETSQIFRGETVTLTCDIQGEDWTYTWQCGDKQQNSDDEEFKITVQFKQSCKCKGCRESFCSEWSDAETLTDSCG